MTKIQRLTASLRILVVVVGGLFLAAYVAIALLRMPVPIELEWTEGVVVDHVHRVVQGRPLYVQPSLEFVPIFYTPGYYYASALFARVLGDGFLAPRLVSFLSSLACLWIIFAIIRRNTGNAYAAAAGACLYAATFDAVAGGWFDIARPDSLFLALLLAAILRLGDARSAGAFAVAGLWLAASVLVKQTALVIGWPLVFYAFWAGPLRGIAFAGTCGGVLAIAGLALEWTSGGWFSRVIGLSGQLGVSPDQTFRYWSHGLLGTLPVACAGAAWLAFRAWALWPDERRRAFLWGAVALGLIGCTWIVRIQRLTASNALMPAYAALAVLFGVSLHTALAAINRTGRAGLAVLVYGAALVQFGVLAYNPVRRIPSAASLAAGARVIDVIRHVEGPVLVYGRGYLARQAGKPDHLNRVAAECLRGPAAQQLFRELSNALCTGRYAAVLLDSDQPSFQELAYRYHPAERLFPDAAVPTTIVLNRPVPHLLYRRAPADVTKGRPDVCRH